MKTIIIEEKDGWYYASQGPGYGVISRKTIAEAIGAYIEINPEMFDIKLILPGQTNLRTDVLFTVDQRKELLAAYVEKTGREGEYLVCSHGFLWDSSGVSDADFATACTSRGIELPK